MNLEQVSQKLELEVRTAAGKLDVEVTGGYASDLLSCVMARAHANHLWITIQSHPNIVAVASLLGLAGIVITEGMTPDKETLSKAEEEGIPLLTTELTTYTVAGRLFELGITGAEKGL